MIIDIHGHTNAPPSLYAYKSNLLASRGAHGKGNPGLNEEALATAVKNHLANNLDKVGTDVQFLSPRPFQLMHSEKPEKIVQWWVQANNDAIAKERERFYGWRLQKQQEEQKIADTVSHFVSENPITRGLPPDPAPQKGPSK